VAIEAATIRPATGEDLPSIRVILAGHGNDGPIVHGDIVGPYLGHLIDRGRTLVTVSSDAVVAFAAAIDTGRGWHLADLFVRSDLLGRGLGRPLLETVLKGATDRTTFASDDPRAMPLYIRAGMAPLWPGLYLEGAGTMLPGGAGTLRVERATADEIAEIDRRWTGEDRRIDHRFWSTQLEAEPFVVRDGADVVGAGHARARQASPVRALDRLVIHPEADPLEVTLSAIRWAAHDGGVLACVPGPSPAVRTLLEAGFRIADRDTFMASRPDLVDPIRFIPNPGMR
jgi:GNAT superfamily N-acetyltransferase